MYVVLTKYTKTKNSTIPPIELGSASAAIELESVAALRKDGIIGDHIPAQIPETARDTLGVLEICFDHFFFFFENLNITAKKYQKTAK